MIDTVLFFLFFMYLKNEKEEEKIPEMIKKSQ
jgi:hypothetical protein